MKSTPSRRLFLRSSALATTGIALLSTSSLIAFNDESPYQGYNQFAENTTDLRTTIFNKHARVKGIIYQKDGLTPVTNASIEVWHLTPNSKKYRHRAKMKTNDLGEYNFITDFPNRETAKTARIFFKITEGEKSVFTELALDHSGGYITSKHWNENQKLGEKLFPKSKKEFNTTIINFNISI